MLLHERFIPKSDGVVEALSQQTAVGDGVSGLGIVADKTAGQHGVDGALIARHLEVNAAHAGAERVAQYSEAAKGASLEESG